MKHKKMSQEDIESPTSGPVGIMIVAGFKNPGSSIPVVQIPPESSTNLANRPTFNFRLKILRRLLSGL